MSAKKVISIIIQLSNYPIIQLSLIVIPNDKNHKNCCIPFVFLILLKQAS